MSVDFAINGRHVREIKVILQSVGINGGTEYDALPFNPVGRQVAITRSRFATSRLRQPGKTMSSNPLVYIADPVRPSVMNTGKRLYETRLRHHDLGLLICRM
jgi:hypothetical protein